MRKSLAVFALSLSVILGLPLTASAAVEYRITIDSVGDLITPHRVLEVTVDGPRRRAEIQTPEKNPVAFNVFLADLDRRPDFTGVNTDLKTWWYPATPVASVPSHGAGPMVDAVIKNLTVTSAEEADGEEIQGFATRKFVIRAAFGVAGGLSPERPFIRYQMTMMVWTTDKLDAATAISAVSPSFRMPEVDAEITAKLKTVKGFPLRTVVAASRAYEGGMPQNEVVTATVSEFRQVRATPHLFDVPDGYTKQQTTYGVPGVSGN